MPDRDLRITRTLQWAVHYVFHVFTRPTLHSSDLNHEVGDILIPSNGTSISLLGTVDTVGISLTILSQFLPEVTVLLYEQWRAHHETHDVLAHGGKFMDNWYFWRCQHPETRTL